MFVSIYIYARRRDNPITYDWRRLVVVLAVSILTYAGCVLTTSAATVPGAAERIVWIAVGGLLLLALGGALSFL